MALRNTIWQHFYACRAEFYANASLSLVDPKSDEALVRRDRAIHERAALGELIEQWQKSFPDQTLAKPSNLRGSKFWIEYSATGFEAVLDKESEALFSEISSWRYDQRQMHLQRDLRRRDLVVLDDVAVDRAPEAISVKNRLACPWPQPFTESAIGAAGSEYFGWKRWTSRSPTSSSSKRVAMPLPTYLRYCKEDSGVPRTQEPIK